MMDITRNRWFAVPVLWLAFVLVGMTKAAPASHVEPGQPVRIVIEAIGLDLPLVAVGLDKNRMPIVPRHDVGWYRLSAMPGQGENIVLWGHVLRFRNAPHIPAPFARIKELEPGDTITLYTAEDRVYHYTVENHLRVTPDQVSYILPQGEERVTLVSCIGERVVIRGEVDMTHRLITLARPTSSPPRSPPSR